MAASPYFSSAPRWGNSTSTSPKIYEDEEVPHTSFLLGVIIYIRHPSPSTPQRRNR